ncbi:MAG: hypothetical protein AB1489_23530 [Acidobacteriota bacterium]
MANTYNYEQIMLCLAYLADVGASSKIKDTSCNTAEQIYQLMLKVLNSWEPIKGQWTIVWGPGVFKFPFVKYYDNVLFIAQSTSNPNTYTVSTSGTNPYSISDWLFEDFLVATQLPWPYGSPPPSLKPKISLSAGLGLTILENLKPCANLPGAGILPMQYLSNAVQKAGSNSVNVYVTGHSLGGALSSVMALWLADTKAQWDAKNQATVNAYCYAGPTAGNGDFASYFDQRIGSNTQRIWNSLDIVPHAWALSDLKQIPTLYQPQIQPEQWIVDTVKGIVDLLTALRSNYQQINPSQQPLPGKVNTKYSNFLEQAGYQHVQAYLDLLGIPSMPKE